MKKKAFIYLGLLFGTLIICISFLFLSSLIPTRVIKDNLKSFISYIMTNREDNNLFFLKDNDSAMLDNYADYMSIKMLYFIDSNHPIVSSLKANSFDTVQDYSLGAVDVINGRVDANFSYWRYWHGNLGVLRILFTFLDIQGIQVLFSIGLGLLLLFLLFILCKNKCYLLSCCIVLAFLVTYSFVVPFCFEFFWMYFIGFLFAVFSALCYKKSNSFFYGMFIVMGVVVNFFDFFTTEMLVPLFSLLLIIYLRRKESIDSSFGKIFRFVIISLLLFVFSYAFTWISKWIISSLLFHENILELLTNRAWKWMGGYDNFKFISHPLLSTLLANISMIFPFKYLPGYWPLIIYSIIIFSIIIFKILRKEFSKYSFIYLILFFIPYIRYIVLMGHSYQHSFFTFRVQFTSIIFLILILFEKKVSGVKKV